jgi:hypothetical protein
MIQSNSLVKYIKQGRHICLKSPSGRHVWGIDTTNRIPGVPRGCWACQHCGEVREPKDWEPDSGKAAEFAGVPEMPGAGAMGVERGSGPDSWEAPRMNNFGGGTYGG